MYEVTREITVKITFAGRVRSKDKIMPQEKAKLYLIYFLQRRLMNASAKVIDIEDTVKEV